MAATATLPVASGAFFNTAFARPQATAKDLQAALEDAVRQGIPGISAAIATRRGIVWRGVTGKSSVASGRRLRSSELIGIGSITKSFVAVAILQLVTAGHLDLHMTAARLLGEVANGIPNADTATVRQLLNHTSGIPSWENVPKWIREGRGADMDPARIWRSTDVLAYIRGSAPLAPAGASYSYANTNYTLLGLMIEKVTGLPLAVALRRQVFRPIGLRNSFLEGYERLPTHRRAGRHHYATAQFRDVAGVNAAFRDLPNGLIDVSPSNLSVSYGAGGMIATAEDVVTFGRALRDGQLLDSRGMALLQDWRIATPATRSVGLGIRRDVRGPYALIGHDGNVLGCSATLFWVEGVDAVVAMLATVGSMHSGDGVLTPQAFAKDERFVDLVRNFIGNLS